MQWATARGPRGKIAADTDEKLRIMRNGRDDRAFKAKVSNQHCFLRRIVVGEKVLWFVVDDSSRSERGQARLSAKLEAAALLFTWQVKPLNIETVPLTQ